MAAGHNYTVTVSRQNYSFQNGSASINDLGSNISVDFVGALNSYSINGQVVAEDGSGEPNVSVLVDGAQTVTTTADASGHFSVTLPAEGDYAIELSKPHRIISPSTVILDHLSGGRNLTFNSTRVRYRISGQVTEAGSALASVGVTLSGDAIATSLTDEQGKYSFAVPAEGDYTLSFAKAHRAFSPANVPVNNLVADVVSNTISSRVNYIVSGQILEGSTPKVGMRVDLTGDVTLTTITDANGNYRFSLPAEGSYTVLPVAPHYAVTPNNYHVSNLVTAESANFAVAGVDTVQFTKAEYVVGEGTAAIDVVVNRTGDVSHDATVRYSMTDGTARQGSDYILATGILRFAPNESSKSFQILIVNDGWVEPADETATVVLSEAEGFVLGGQNSVMLKIQDSGTIWPINPIENSQVFLTQHYADFLARVPDSGGLAYWQSQFDQCNGDANCISSKRVGVSAAFFIESEFQETGGFVFRLFNAGLGRRPLYSEFMRERGDLLSYDTIANGKKGLADDVAARPEFETLYPTTLDKSTFIDRLLANVKLNTGVDLVSQRESLLTDYNANSSRGRILASIADHPLIQAAGRNRAFVLMQYFGYLRRDPEQGGYDFWLSVLDRQPGNFRGMVCAFLTSAEFQQRFSQLTPRTDHECAAIQ
jgi:hypothetical protein